MNVLKGFRGDSNHRVTCLRNSLYKITGILRVSQKSDKVRTLKIVSNYVIKKEVPKSTVSIKRVFIPDHP